VRVSSETETQHVAGQLSRLDRFLPVWIGLAMVGGLLLGSAVPQLDEWLNKLTVGTTSVPIAIGLLVMMYPVLAKVRWEGLGRIGSDPINDRALFASSLFLSWVVGPLLMFALAWILLPNEPAFRTGVIIVGLARCIAMVLVWNDIACGDRDRAAILVVFNALFQVLAYGVLGWFYLTVLPGWLGLNTCVSAACPAVGAWEVGRTVLVFLGIPLVAGLVTRMVLVRRRGVEWYESRFIPRVSPFTLYGLLFTIVLLFALQGQAILDNPLDVVKIALPLLCYFAIMWVVGFVVGRRIRMGYPQTATLAFTVASNDFELAIAVAVGVFGATSGEALAGTVGPLVEVPVLLGLVYLALWARDRFTWPRGSGRTPTQR
jgi:arsenical-resistance protein